MSLRRAGLILAALAVFAYVVVLATFIHEIKGPGLLWLVSQPPAHNIFIISTRIAIALVGIGGGLVFFLYYLVIALRNAVRRQKRDEGQPHNAWLGMVFAGFLVVGGAAILSLHARAENIVRPRTEIRDVGISFLSPDEDGWMVLSLAGQWSTLGKYGVTRLETYTIQMTHLRASCPSSEEAFVETVKRSVGTNSDRFKYRSARVELDRSPRPYARVNYYTAAEDYGAHGMPQNQKFSLLVAMGFLACHPSDPQRIEKAEYSYRYYPERDDPDFERKAMWVLDHVNLTGP